jgi:DNA-binding NarL/FixJ family response regulator
MPVRILIADDHEVVRQGVRAMILRSRHEWEICGEAATGDEALQAIQALKPDVAILDITMPPMSGLEVAHEVNRRHLRTALLMFTMHESARLVTEVREAGAQGFVNKSCAGRDLIAAIEALLAGGTFFGEAAAIGPSGTPGGGDPCRGLSFFQQLRHRWTSPLFPLNPFRLVPQAFLALASD